tara:strand:- start:1501 stop:2148 length:648 start_codon:yes stop_codon:yes gene_type:complete
MHTIKIWFNLKFDIISKEICLSGNRINYVYGRKIGLVKLFISRFYNCVGRYKAYKKVRWGEVRRLVFICHGNICRSAYAEARARHIGLSAASAGLGADRGGKANPQAIKVAFNRKIDLQFHKTTNVDDLVISEGDLFLCMEPSQAILVENLLGKNARQQVSLLGLWSEEKRPFLQDPYELLDEYWDTCFNIIDSALSRIRLNAVNSGAKVIISGK